MEAEPKTIWSRDWVKLSHYAKRKTDETGDADIARGLVVRELQREGEGRLPYRYKRADDIDQRWHDEGLPVGYDWGDAQINWPAGTARWPARFRPGLDSLGELQIYHIEVVPPVAAKPAADGSEPNFAENELAVDVATSETAHGRLLNIFAALGPRLTRDMKPADASKLAKPLWSKQWPDKPYPDRTTVRRALRAHFNQK
jgi:hypothetical protein